MPCLPWKKRIGKYWTRSPAQHIKAIDIEGLNGLRRDYVVTKLDGEPQKKPVNTRELTHASLEYKECVPVPMFMGLE